MISWLRYVTLDAVGEYLFKGWAIVDDFSTVHHGNYAVLMRYCGEGEPQ
jgi:hypothetical protein